MVVETGIIVAGTGYAGSAILRELADSHAPFIFLDKAHGEMLLDVILSEDGKEVAGARILRDGAVEVLRAPCIVLATGSLAGLLPNGDWKLSGDGQAIAHRAGLTLSTPTVDPERGLHAGVLCSRDGRTALEGLLIAGSLGADRPDPAKVAHTAVLRARQGCEPLGPYPIHPTVDDPLPRGFADVKFDRLRTLCEKAFLGEFDRERALIELHRLKGEADEYARARSDATLFSLQNACEVAVLLLRTC